MKLLKSLSAVALLLIGYGTSASELTQKEQIAGLVVIANGKASQGKYEEAHQFLLRAASLGDADSQYLIATMYSLGLGVEPSLNTAHSWMLKAANQGHAKAQYKLGHMYREGQGVTRYLKKAKELYRLACNNGLEDGCDAYVSLNK